MRTLVLVLVVVNVLLFAWNRGWIGQGSGLAGSAREPDRLARQIAPDSVRVVTDAAGAVAAPAASEPASAPADVAACLEAGPFGAVALAAAEQLLTALAPGRWQRVDAGEGVLLRVEGADDALAAQLKVLDAAVLAGGFRTCEAR
jgi:hypothetical protein